MLSHSWLVAHQEKEEEEEEEEENRWVASICVHRAQGCQSVLLRLMVQDRLPRSLQ